MKEDDSNWFSKWEEELPSPEELIPLSQTLITPDLALAFDIRYHAGATAAGIASPVAGVASTFNQPPPPPPAPALAAPSQPNSGEFGADSGEFGSGAGGDEPARTLKRPRLVWTPQLHKRFVDAVAHLGIKNAVPKTIMQLMSVDGLTRENVASHLQKYRLYLKRMQGLGGGSGGSGAGSDTTTDHLFASSPVPPQFLHPTRPNSEHFLPYVTTLQQQQQQQQQQRLHQQMVAAAAAVGNPQLQSQYNMQMGQFCSPRNRGFEHSFLARQTQQQNVHRIGMSEPGHSLVAGYTADLDSPNGNGGSKVLTLFPTGED